MKKTFFIISILCLSFLFCACGDYIELTKKEESLLAEYVADRLLNNDTKFESNLVSDERLQILKKPKTTQEPDATATPTPTEAVKEETSQGNTSSEPVATQTPKPTPTKAVTDSISDGLSLSALMNKSNGYVSASKDETVRAEVDGKLSEVVSNGRLSVVYKGFSISDEVRISQSSMLQDTVDKKYVIFDIAIKNNNSLGEKINTSTYTFTLIINGTKRIRQTLALSNENLTYLDKALVPNEEFDGKLYFEVGDDVVIDKLELEVINGNKQTEKIVLK